MICLLAALISAATGLAIVPFVLRASLSRDRAHNGSDVEATNGAAMHAAPRLWFRGAL